VNTSRIVLASASPRRRALMAKLGIAFRTVNIRFKERIPQAKPEDAALLLAWSKLKAARRRVRRGIVVTADTIVALGGRIFGKPGSKREACHMLSRLSGATHEVITAIAVHDSASGTSLLGFERTWVTMRALRGKEIAEYVESGEPSDKAGAYGIQGMGGTLILGIRGDYFNVVGFPLRLFSAFVESVGIKVARSRLKSLYSGKRLVSTG